MATIQEIIAQNKLKREQQSQETTQKVNELLVNPAKLKVTLPSVGLKLPVKLINTLAVNTNVNLTINENHSDSCSDSCSQSFIIPQESNQESQDPDIDPILNKIEELRISLHSVHPNMPNLLHDIWKQLKDTPECVTILKPDQMGVIIQALERQTNVKLSESISKPKTTRKAKVTENDV